MSSGQESYFVLPYPPSVNQYWRQFNGRTILSKAGRDYKHLVGLVLVRQASGKPLVGRVAVSIVVHPPDRRRRDLDNTLKAVLDSLRGVAYEDDSQIERLFVERDAIVRKGKVLVKVKGI